MGINRYDALVIGGSINSLAISALLGKKGKKVILLESSKNIGEALQAEQFFEHKTNMIYDYIRWIDPRIVDELNLHKYGLKFTPTNPLRISLDEHKQHIIFYNNPEKTAESISQHSKKDAKRWGDFTKYIEKLTYFLEPIYKTAPPKISELGMKDIMAMKGMFYPLKRYGTKGLTDLMRTIPMMMPELLDEWFESNLLRGSLSTSGIFHLTQGPYSAATMLNFLHQHMYSAGRIHNANFIEGGTGKLMEILLEIAKSNGVQIKTGTKLNAITSSNNICTGASLIDGETYEASHIISGLDPYHTFIKLMGNSKLPPRLYTQINNIKYRGSVARLHFLLRALPEIPGVKKEQMSTIFSINPSLEYLEKAYDDVKYGNISNNPYIEFSFPTLTSSKDALNNKHILSATVQFVPYHLKDSRWNYEIKNQIINKTIKLLEKYIPNFSNIIEKTTLNTPVDLEKTLAIKEGNINHGEMMLDQFFFMRPTISTAQYHTPIKNLFLCGPSVHPGGGIHLMSAVNVINNIL